MTSPTLDKKDSLEIFYKPKVFYEITINPAKQAFGKVGRLAQVYEAFSKFLHCFNADIEYQFTVELSEPRFGNIDRGSESRIHWHGWLKFPTELDVAKFLLYDVSRLKRYCDYSINTMREEYWKKYMTKQESIMRPLCSFSSIPYLVTHKNPQYKIANTSNIKGYFET